MYSFLQSGTKWTSSLQLTNCLIIVVVIVFFFYLIFFIHQLDNHDKILDEEKPSWLALQSLEHLRNQLDRLRIVCAESKPCVIDIAASWSHPYPVFPTPLVLFKIAVDCILLFAYNFNCIFVIIIQSEKVFLFNYK